MEIILLLVFFYGLFIFISIIGFSLNNFQIKFNNKSKVLDSSLSLIIPFRNESKRVLRLLESINRQATLSCVDKLIFVDDHSTDQSYETLKNWISKNPYNCELKKLQSYYGKKRAIDFAISYSDTDYILVLDADTSFKPNFFKKLAHLSVNDVDLYIFPVIEDNGVFYSKLISYVISIITIGMASLKLPILANGAALFFKKSSYQKINPFNNNFHISSGDDMFLLKKFNEKNLNIKSIYNHELIVYTEGSNNFKNMILRSLRWSGKMNSSGFNLTIIFGILVLICNLFIWPLIIYAYLYSEPKFLILILIKFLTDFIVLLFASFKFKNFSIIKYSIVTFLFYPLILMIILFLSVINYRFKWKEREVINT